MVEIHPSDILACGGFLPERVVPRALDAAKLDVLVSKFETDEGTGAARDAEGLGDGGTDRRTRGRAVEVLKLRVKCRSTRRRALRLAAT